MSGTQLPASGSNPQQPTPSDSDLQDSYVDLHKPNSSFKNRNAYLNHELQIMQPKRWRPNLPFRDYRFEYEDTIPAMAATIGKVVMVGAIAQNDRRPGCGGSGRRECPRSDQTISSGWCDGERCLQAHHDRHSTRRRDQSALGEHRAEPARLATGGSRLPLCAVCRRLRRRVPRTERGPCSLRFSHRRDHSTRAPTESREN